MRESATTSFSQDECLAILSISPFEEDHARLRAIVGRFSKLLIAPNLPAAKRLLESRNIFLVLCECDSNPGTWLDSLEYLESLPNPPLLIVTSRLADERLWAEVLNLGAWDVLAKPFDDDEVLRAVKSTMVRYRSSAQLIAKPFSLTAAD
jgi:DNA-binding response OmpR family regulator